MLPSAGYPAYVVRAGHARETAKPRAIEPDEQDHSGANPAHVQQKTLRRSVADYVSEIAAAGKAQTSSLDQVYNAVSGIGEMTRQNAMLVKETPVGIHAAVDQVAQLRKAVGFFTTASSTTASDDRPQALPGGPASQRHDAARRMAAASAWQDDESIKEEPGWIEL